MVYVVTAVVLVAAVTALNLLFTLGIVRRLREHTELLSRSGGHGEAAANGVLKAGETVAEFDTTTVDGATFGRDDLAEGAMVAFFSPTCAPCRERMPEFVALAETIPAGARHAFAVVIGDPAETAQMVERLRPVARVVTGPAAEPVATAFGTEAYPALYRMAGNGVVAASGHSLSVYPVLATA